MKLIIAFSLALILFAGCKKEHHHSVDIYLLKSFNVSVGQSSTGEVSNTNAILDDAPLVANQDIRFYKRKTTTFILKKDIKTILQNYGADKAFAVTIDDQPVYYGKFHPGYLSSLAFGVATIDPLMIVDDKELKIDFISIEGNSFLQLLDKRNDERIINALRSSGRLR